MIGKFKRGDIVRNRWAGEKNPIRYFIIWKIYGKKVSVIELINKRLQFEQNSYTNVYELYHDGEPAFVKVGKSKMFEVAMNDLTDLLEEREC